MATGTIDWLYSEIPVGKDNAISRYDLRTKLGMSDRKMREVIHDAKVAGYLICSTSRGYYIPDDIEDIKHQYFREKKRIASTYAAIRQMRAILKDKGVEV